MTLPTRFTSHAVAAAAALAVCLGAGAGRAADADKGKAAFMRQCAICHTIEKGDPNRFGPNLFGIVGKKAGAVQEFVGCTRKLDHVSRRDGAGNRDGDISRRGREGSGRHRRLSREQEVALAPLLECRTAA